MRNWKLRNVQSILLLAGTSPFYSFLYQGGHVNRVSLMDSQTMIFLNEAEDVLFQGLSL